MKKYFLIPILSGLLLTVGCSEQLDRLPFDSLVDASAYRTVSDLERGLVGALGQLNPDNVVAFNAIFTDNCRIGIDNGGQQLGLLNQILASNAGDQGLWADRYNTLNLINRVLAASESVTPTGTAEELRYNDVVGRARALRGFFHLELLTYYGLDMSNGASLGVPIQDAVNTSGFKERDTTADVFAAIEADFAAASTLITSTDVNFPTADFVTFARARAALFSGDYAAAVTYASTIISKYPLASATQYAAMFGGDADATEVIFKYDNVQGANNSVAGNFIFTGTGGDFIEASSELFNAFTPGDIRRDIAMIPSVSPQNTGDALTINKYPANADVNYINDYKMMRVAEMYLVRAEAYARQSQFGPAAADVQTLRTARGSSATTASAAYANLNAAIQDIKDERRLELCFEGHRYVDIKRYASILNVGITRDAADVSYLGNNFPSTVSATDNRLIFPIPDAELAANPDITQAPGY